MEDEPLQLIPKETLTEMETALELIKENLDTYLEFQKYQAILTKAKYDAYIKEGFDAYQALELCKTI
jgi:hypothetical protein